MSRLPLALTLLLLIAAADAAEAVSEPAAGTSPDAEVQVIPEPATEPASDPAVDAGLEVVDDFVPEPEPLPPIPRPSMNYIGFSAFEYSSEPADGGRGVYWKGPGVEINFGWQASEFAVVTGRLRRTEAERERIIGFNQDLVENHYELGLAFAAPLGERTRLLLETGWAREEFDDESRVIGGSVFEASADDSQGLYAAIELRTMLGRWFELDLRSAGHQLFDTRRQVHSGGFRFHVSRRVAFGVHQERWERDLRKTTRTSLDMRIDF